MTNSFYQDAQNYPMYRIVKDPAQQGRPQMGEIVTIVAVGSAVISGVKKIREAIGGKYAEGIHHRKIAAGINGLLGWGWTLDQIRTSPDLIAAVVRTGSWPQPIKDVASGGAGSVRDAMQELGIKPTAPPSGSWNKLLFYNPPPDGAALDPILASVFPGIPPYGGDLTAYFNSLQSAQATAKLQQNEIMLQQQATGNQPTNTTNAQVQTDKKNDIILYGGIGAGILLVGGIIYLIVKKK